VSGISATGEREYQRAKGHEGTVRRIGRVGYVAYGVIHLLVAWLVVQLAFGGSGGKSADTTGAFAELGSSPVGRVLLVALVVGLGLLAIWKVSEAVLGPDTGGDGKKAVWTRVGAGAQAAVFVVLAVSAGKFAFGGGSSSASSKQQGATSQLIGLPGGPVWVVLIGLAVVGAGVGLAVYGLTRKFAEKMDLSRLRVKSRRLVRGLGAVGYTAKGAAYGVVGVLLVVAGATYDPKKSRGLDGAIRTVASQPVGRVLLVAVAAGIACFGVFCFVRARHQRR
jgi:Domain of Unknown Function (DUF1206)